MISLFLRFGAAAAAAAPIPSLPHAPINYWWRAVWTTGIFFWTAQCLPGVGVLKVKVRACVLFF